MPGLNLLVLRLEFLEGLPRLIKRLGKVNMSRFWRVLICLVVFASVGVPTLVLAQSQGSIAGTVTDESKAVLPGVTVTATE